MSAPNVQKMSIGEGQTQGCYLTYPIQELFAPAASASFSSAYFAASSQIPPLLTHTSKA